MSEAPASRVSRLAAKRGPSAPERSDESGQHERSPVEATEPAAGAGARPRRSRRAT